MELDNFKQTWKQTPVKTGTNTDIMEIIHRKSYGPLAELKTTFKKQMIAMSVIPFVLLLTNISDVHAVLTSILFWSYVAFCIGIIAFAFYNYRIVRQLETMDGMVRATLERQIDLLEKRARMEVAGMRVVLLFFIVLVEVVPYLQHYRMLDKWHSLSPFLRFGAYALLLALQYFLNRSLKHRKVGRHLEYLKDLAAQLQ